MEVNDENNDEDFKKDDNYDDSDRITNKNNLTNNSHSPFDCARSIPRQPHLLLVPCDDLLINKLLGMDQHARTT